MTSVVDVRHEDFDVYIGRKHGRYPKSIWANPFVIGPDGSRAEVIAKYRDWLQTQPHLLKRFPELKNQILGCGSHPLSCHGDVQEDLSNAA